MHRRYARADVPYKGTVIQSYRSVFVAFVNDLFCRRCYLIAVTFGGGKVSAFFRTLGYMSRNLGYDWTVGF